MSIFKKYVPSLVENGKVFTSAINTPLRSAQQLGSNIDNLIDQNVFPNEVKVVLEFDKNFTTPYFFMRKTDNGRISLYMAVLMKQTTFNKNYTGLSNVPIWVITSTNSDEYKRKFVNAQGQQVERIAYGNGNPFYLLYGSHSTQANGATVTGSLTETLLPTKPSSFNKDEYIRINGEASGQTVAQVLNTTCLKIWKNLNILAGTFEEDDDIEIDSEKMQSVWDQYEHALATYQDNGHVHPTTSVYASDNQVHIGNYPFLSDNLACNQLNPKVFLGKKESQVTDLPSNKVVLIVKKQPLIAVENSDFQYGLYQLEGIRDERIVIEDEDIASVTAESYTGRVSVRDNIGNDLPLDIRIIEADYGRKNQRIPKPARSFNNVSEGSEVLLMGELEFVPNGTDGHGVKCLLIVDKYKIIKGTENSNIISNDFGNDLDDFNLDFLNDTPPVVETTNTDDESKPKETNQSDDDMNS